MSAKLSGGSLGLSSTCSCGCGSGEVTRERAKAGHWASAWQFARSGGGLRCCLG